MNQKVILILISWLCSNAIHAQDSILSNFGLASIDNTVQLNWTVSKGNTCNGIQILHSTDSLNFTEIGAIPGICGSIEQAESYSFSHLNPAKNQVNYYRLELGPFGLSSIRQILYIPTNTSGIGVFPNPTFDELVIYFENLSRDKYTATVYGISGEILDEQTSTTSLIEFDSAYWPSGLYFITLKSVDGSVKKTSNVVKLTRFK